MLLARSMKLVFTCKVVKEHVVVPVAASYEPSRDTCKGHQLHSNSLPVCLHMHCCSCKHFLCGTHHTGRLLEQPVWAAGAMVDGRRLAAWGRAAEQEHRARWDAIRALGSASAVAGHAKATQTLTTCKPASWHVLAEHAAERKLCTAAHRPASSYSAPPRHTKAAKCTATCSRSPPVELIQRPIAAHKGGKVQVHLLVSRGRCGVALLRRLLRGGAEGGGRRGG